MATSSVGEAGTVYAPQRRGKAGIRLHGQFVIGPIERMAVSTEPFTE
jgi:hypothetical protein